MNEQERLFIKIFIYEFTREFLFLSDVAAGRASRRTTITDTLLSLLSSAASHAPMASGPAQAGVSALSYWHEWHLGKAVAHIDSINDETDPEELKIIVEMVGREILRRYDYFIATRLTENYAEGIIPLAKCAVHRILEYLARTRSEITVDTMLLGLIEGRTGSWVDGFFSNATLKGKGVYALTKLFAESVFARSAFRTLDGQLWIRRERQPGTLYHYGCSDFRTTQPNQPRNGYALVPQTLVDHYGYELHTPIGADKVEVEQHPVSVHHMTVADIQAYLDQKGTGESRLYHYICQRHPGTTTVICAEDLTQLNLAGGDFSDCDFSNACFSGNLSGTHFDRCYLIGAIFQNILTMDHASFIEAHCQYSFWNEVSGREVNFSRAQFQFAAFTATRWLDCPFPGALWYAAKVDDLLITHDSVQQALQIMQLETQAARVERFLLEFTEYEQRLTKLETTVNMHSLVLEQHTTEIAQLHHQKKQLTIIEEQLQVLSDKPNLTKALQIFLRQIAQNPDSSTLNQAFDNLRPWLKTADTDIDSILLYEEQPHSLLKALRQFYQLWQQNRLLCCDEDLFDEASACYRALVNIELRRATFRLKLKDLPTFRHALTHLYELAFLMPSEIDQPLPVLRTLIKKLALGSASSSDIAFLTQPQNADVALLVARVCRRYVDLTVHRYMEFIQKREQEGELHQLLRESVRYLGETLYYFTGRQSLLLVLADKPTEMYSRNDITEWRHNIRALMSYLHPTKESEARATYDVIVHELRQMIDGLKTFPQTSIIGDLLHGPLPSLPSHTSPGAAIPGLLKMAYRLARALFHPEYADMLYWRSITSLICQATEKQAEDAKVLLMELQQALAEAVQAKNYIVSFSLVDVMRFIATHAFLPDIRCQAFFGSHESETPALGVATFINIQWSQHSHLSALHHFAIISFKEMMLASDHPAFDMLLERLTAPVDAETEADHMQLLNLFHEWLIDTPHAQVAQGTLIDYLKNCLQEILNILREQGTEAQLLLWGQRAHLVQAPKLWKQWSRDNKRDARKFSDELMQFYTRLSEKDTSADFKAKHIALALLMLLSPEQTLQNLLHYTKLSTERVLNYALQGILAQLFKLRNKLIQDVLRTSQCQSLLQELANVLIIPNVYSEASEFLYRYLPSAVFFSDTLRRTVQGLLQQPAIIAGQPRWCQVWVHSCEQLTHAPGHRDFVAHLEYCIDGEFVSFGKLSVSITSNRLDENGLLISTYPTSKNIVNNFVEAQLHLKAYPEFPANEIAARIVQRHLTGQWNMAQLVWFHVQQAEKLDYRYPVLITQTIPGVTLKNFADNPNKVVEQVLRQQAANFNAKNFQCGFSWQVIYALLMRLGDAKDSNYILSPEGHLQVIDQEELFQPAFLPSEEIKLLQQQKREIRHPLGIKNILFCMREMDDELDEEVMEAFLKLSPEAVLQHSLAHMAEYNHHLQSSEIENIEASYREKVKQAARARQLQKALVSVLKIEFPSETFSQCYDDFVRLQRYLQQAKQTGKKVTHRDLLNKLEPALGALYQRVFEAEPTPTKRFAQLTSGYDLVEVIEETESLDAEAAQVSETEKPTLPIVTTYHVSLKTAARFYQAQNQGGSSRSSQAIYDHALNLSHDTMDACMELEVHIKAHQKVQKVQSALMQGDLNRLKKYFTLHEAPLAAQAFRIWKAKQRLISIIWEYMDFTKLKEKEPIIIAHLLRALGQNIFTHVRHLHLIGARTLTDDQFEQLICHFPELRWVSLEHCENLGQDSLIALAKHCLQLVMIKLGHLSALQKISSWISAKRIYPMLIKFIVTACENLTEIDIEASQLRYLEASDNPKLSALHTQSSALFSLNISGSVAIDTSGFKKIASQWEHLQRLDISFCTKVELDQLYFRDTLFPIIPTGYIRRFCNNLLMLRIKGCIKEYNYYLNDPRSASLLTTEELQPYFDYYLRQKILQVEHLPEDASHWLLHLLSELPELQVPFLHYILARYTPDTPEQDAVYRWLAKYISEGLFITLDFSRVSCDYRQLLANSIVDRAARFEAPWALVSLPNGQIASSHSYLATKGIIKIWNIQTAYCVDEIYLESMAYNLLSLPNGQIACGIFNPGAIMIWDLQKRQRESNLICKEGGPAFIDGLAALPNNQLASSTSYDIKIWNLHTKECIYVINRFSNTAVNLVFLPDGYLASTSNYTIRVWDIHTWKNISTLRWSNGSTAIVALPNRQLATGSTTGGGIKIWNLQTSQQIANIDNKYKNSTSQYQALTILPDGQIVGGAQGGALKIWNVKNKQCINQLQEHTDNIKTLAVLPSGYLVSGSDDCTIRYWIFHRAVMSQHAKYIADALLNSISVTSLAGSENLEDVKLRTLIELRVKRNQLFQEKSLENVGYTLLDAARELGDTEAVEYLTQRPEKNQSGQSALFAHTMPISHQAVELPKFLTSSSLFSTVSNPANVYSIPAHNLSSASGTRKIFSPISTQPKVPSDNFSGNTLGDGNCAFNAFALGLARIILSDRDYILPTEFILPFPHIEEERRSGLQKWIADHRHDPVTIQKTLASALRTCAVEVIERDYPQLYAENFHVQLENAFQQYRANPSRDDTHTFLSQPNILAAMQQYRNFIDFMGWWGTEGRGEYFTNMTRDAEGKASRYGSFLELTVLARLFNITIQIEGDAEQYQRLGVLCGECENLSDEDFKLLHILQITEELRDVADQRVKAYICNSDPEEIQQLLSDIPPTLYEKVSAHLSGPFEAKAWSGEEKEHLTRRKAIENGHWATKTQKNFDPITGKERTIIIDDPEEVLFRLRSLTLEARENILRSQKSDIPVIVIKHFGLHWEYHGLEDVWPHQQKQSISLTR